MEYKRADSKVAKRSVMTSSKLNYPLLTGFSGHQCLSVSMSFFFFLSAVGCGDYTTLQKASDVSGGWGEKKIKTQKIKTPKLKEMGRDLPASLHNSTKRAFTPIYLMAKSFSHKIPLCFLFRKMSHLSTENVCSLNSRGVSKDRLHYFKVYYYNTSLTT